MYLVVTVCRSTSQTRVSASQGTTPRTGTMSSRDLRAARAARSARSTSPAAAKHLKNGTRAPPPLQTRSLQAFHQMSTEDDVQASGREARQHTLPSVSRKKSQAASAESRKSAVDDFHFEYDYARQGSEQIVAATPDNDGSANHDDFAMYRRDNLSQDSYRITDSRDSSVDRLEMRTKADVDADLIGGAEPLDEAKLIEKLEHEQQLQESREMQERNGAVADSVQQNELIQRNDDVVINGTEKRLINGDDVHVIKAEWDLPESALETEVEKIVSIETTKIVETVETTRVAPRMETYRRQKRLSRENAVRVVDEDMPSSPPPETETSALETTDVPPEFAVPVSVDRDEVENKEIFNLDEICPFVISFVDDVVRKAAEEVRATATAEKAIEPLELSIPAATEESESTFYARDYVGSPAKEFADNSLRETAEDMSRDETTILTNDYDKSELEEDKELELNRQSSEDAAESQITVVEVELTDVEQEIDTTDEGSGKPLDAVTMHTVLEESVQQSPTDVTSPHQEVLETAELRNDTDVEDSLPSAVCEDSTKPCAATDQQTEEAVVAETDVASEEIQAAVDEVCSETEKQRTQDTTEVSEVSQKIDDESKQPPDETRVSEEVVAHEPAAVAETADDIPYVLHKRHIVSAADKTAAAGDTRRYATLPTRHHPSRSRSLSPGHRLPVMLTSEQKRSQMMKVKASLVSMAAEMAARGSPKSHAAGVSAPPTKRVLDFVVCSRLPPRDSFSSRDDTLSPPDECDITLASRDKKALSTEKEIVREPETNSSRLSNSAAAEIVENVVEPESKPAGDLTKEACPSEPLQHVAHSPSIEVSALAVDESLNAEETDETREEEHTADAGKLRTREAAESESESDGRLIGDEAAATTPELEDEVNRILSECEQPAAGEEDNGSLASGVSEKFTDESPEAETSRDIEANLRTVAESAALPEHDAGVSSSPPDVDCSETRLDDHSREVAAGLPADVEVQPPVTPSSLEAVVDQSLDGVLTQSGDADADSQQRETGAAACDGVAAGYDAAELAAAEQRLLLQLQTDELAVAVGENISSSSSHSLNDQLDAELLPSRSSALPLVVDAACRLSESSADEPPGPAGRGLGGRNVHLLDWLEEQAQLRGVGSSPHSDDANNISDEDDVEHAAVFADDLQDMFAALEAEVLANPFLVPITPHTSDMCVNATTTSERLSIEDDSSLGVVEAASDAHRKLVPAVSDDESKEMGALGVAEVAGDARCSQLSLSISSEDDVVVEHVDDLPDPLEVLEVESRALPLQGAQPVCLLSDSDSLSDECRRDDEDKDVGDVLDRVDEGRRLSLSDLDDDERPLAAVQRPAADTSSDSDFVGPVCVEEEADAFAGVDVADDLTGGDGDGRRQRSDDDVRSGSSSSAVDSDPAAAAALGSSFVEQVMMHHSVTTGSQEDDRTITEQDAATEIRRELHDEDTSHTACEIESSSTAAQHSQPADSLRLPQGAEASADTACISDEDDVEHGIEDSLQDVFAALEAEVEAKRLSLPVTPLTSDIVISYDTFSDDDEEMSSDLTSKIARGEHEATSYEFTEAAATEDFGEPSYAAATDSVFPRTDTGETSRVDDERVRDTQSKLETVDVDIYALPAEAGIDTSPAEAATLDQRRTESAEGTCMNDVIQPVSSDTSVEPTLNAASTHTSEPTVQDDAAERQTNEKELHGTGTSQDSSHVSNEVAESDTGGIATAEIAHFTETLDSSAHLIPEDDADKHAKAETHSDDENASTDTAAAAADQESDIITSDEAKSCEREVADEVRCSDEGGTAAEPVTQDVEEQT